MRSSLQHAQTALRLQRSHEGSTLVIGCHPPARHVLTYFRPRFVHVHVERVRPATRSHSCRVGAGLIPRTVQAATPAMRSWKANDLPCSKHAQGRSLLLCCLPRQAGDAAMGVSMAFRCPGLKTQFVNHRPVSNVCVCCQAGDAETGVSVAFTVRAMDAGPVLAAERVAVEDDVQAPELLQALFDRGARWDQRFDRSFRKKYQNLTGL